MNGNNEIALEKYEAIINEAKHFASVVRRYVAPTKEDDFCSRSELMNELNDLERAIHRGFLAAGVENVPVGIIKETADECLAQMKPAEWSEEDEHRKTDAIYFLESAKKHYADTSEIEKTIVWLKSLRPSWKPSEEQQMPDSTKLIAEWEREKAVLEQKDFRGDAERKAYNAFLDGFAKGLGYRK